jgi:WD40 repeat protein
VLEENNLQQVKILLDRYRDAENIRGVYWDHIARASGYFPSKASQGKTALKTLAHETMVRSVSVSADGTRLASMTMTGKVRLYHINHIDDLDDSTPIQEFGGGVMSYGAHDGSVSLSPDGRLLAADQQGILKVWDTETGEPEFEKERVMAPICFSPDSASLLSNTENGLTLWKVADWSSVSLLGAELQKGAPLPCAPVFTPDGRWLIISASPFATRLLVYNVTNDAFEGSLTGLDSPNTLTTDGTLVAAGGKDGNVWIWNLENRERLTNFKAHTSIVLATAFSPDGKILATGGNESVIHLWNTTSFEKIGMLEGHQKQIWNLKSSRDRSILASASMDHSVKLWNWKEVLAAEEPKEPRDDANTAMVTTTPMQRPPRTLTLAPGDDIQRVLDSSVAGDTIELAAGTYEITNTILVNKPLTIQGVAAEDAKASTPMPTLLKGETGLRTVIRIETGSADKSIIRDVQIENQASGIRHKSGAFDLIKCRVIIRAALDFNSVFGLGAKGYSDGTADTVIIDGCTLLAEYSGNTPESTPPDVDIVLADSGAKYDTILVTNSNIINNLPNSIANGIEARQTSALLQILGNQIRCQGMAIVPFDHVRSFDIRDNRIWSGTRGVIASIDSPEQSTIAGNHITVEDLSLEVFPLHLQNYIAKRDSFCIGVAPGSAGISAGFFHKAFVDRGTNIRIEDNVLAGNPKVGISLADSPEPENFGPPTPNYSNKNIITGNNFTGLNSKRDIALGQSTYENVIFHNVGIETVFKEAGDRDRNNVSVDR